MWIRLTIFLLAAVGHVSSILQSPVLSETTQTKNSCEIPKTTKGKLKKALFCGYDSSVRPVFHHSNTTAVKMAAFPVSFNYFMETRNQVWVTFMLNMNWQDPLLTWNISEYEGILDITFEPGKTWTPDIFISEPLQSVSLPKQMNCIVTYLGSVACSALTTFNVHCDIDMTYFPYDHHSCKVVFQPRSSKVDLSPIELTQPLKYYRSHNNWDIDSLKVKSNETELFGYHIPTIEYTFVIERKVSSFDVSYATALVMILMVLSTFWLEVHSSARIILPGLAVVSHILIITWLTQSIHPTFDHTPLIILFFRDSLLMTGFSIIWTVAARSLCSSSFTPHALYIVTTNINKNQFAKFLLPQDILLKSGPTDEDESSLVVHRDCVEQQWRIITILTDRILFIFYGLLYMFFYILLAP